MARTFQRFICFFLISASAESFSQAATEEKFFKSGDGIVSQESANFSAGQIDFQLTIRNLADSRLPFRLSESLRRLKDGAWQDTYTTTKGGPFQSVAQVKLKGRDFSTIEFDHSADEPAKKIFVTRTSGHDDMEIYDSKKHLLFKWRFLPVTAKEYEEALKKISQPLSPSAKQ